VTAVQFPSPNQSWRRLGLALVRERELGEGVVFDPSTGETHFLTELPALLLSVVDREPASQDTLVDRLAGPLDLDSTAEAQVLAALVYLEGAELVESLPPSN